MVVVTCVLPSTPVLSSPPPPTANDHYIWCLSFLFWFSYVYCKWIFFCNTLWWLFSCSVVSTVHVAPWTTACQASLTFTISWSLLTLRSVELMTLANCLILSPPSPAALILSRNQGHFQ